MWTQNNTSSKAMNKWRVTEQKHILGPVNGKTVAGLIIVYSLKRKHSHP